VFRPLHLTLIAIEYAVLTFSECVGMFSVAHAMPTFPQLSLCQKQQQLAPKTGWRPESGRQGATKEG
jgi:hypothetical protein